MTLKNVARHVTRNPNFRVVSSAATANIFTLALSCAACYPSPAVPNINANKNPFHVNIDEQSWIGSAAFLGNAFGSLICGSVSDYLGRKLTMMSCAVFCVIGCTLVSAATNVTMIYLGMFVTGAFGSIVYASVILYCSEIAASNNRGILVTMSGSAGTLGIVLALVAGSYLPWNWLAIFIAALFAFPPLVLAFLPESPRWFLLKGNREAAAHSLSWFRGEDANIEEELHVIGQSLIDAPKGMSAWKDLLKGENAKPLFMVCILLLVQTFSGNIVIAIFTVTIFQEAKVDIKPNLQSVIVVCFSFLGSISCLFLVERCGRRPLLFVSIVFTTLGMGMLASYFQIRESDPHFATSHLSWLPMLGLSLSNFMFYAGLTPVPWLLACELFSTNVRGVVITVVNVFVSLFSFVATKTFADIQSAIDTSGAFWFYTACGAAGIAFVFAVKEPKKEIMG